MTARIGVDGGKSNYMKYDTWLVLDQDSLPLYTALELRLLPAVRAVKRKLFYELANSPSLPTSEQIRLNNKRVI